MEIDVNCASTVGRFYISPISLCFRRESGVVLPYIKFRTSRGRSLNVKAICVVLLEHFGGDSSPLSWELYDEVNGSTTLWDAHSYDSVLFHIG